MSDREKFEEFMQSNRDCIPCDDKDWQIMFIGWKGCAKSMQAEITHPNKEQCGKCHLWEHNEKLDAANARIAQLEEALRFIADSPKCVDSSPNHEHWPHIVAASALVDSDGTWLAERIKEAEVKVLEEAALLYEKNNGSQISTGLVAFDLRRLAESRRAK